MKERLPSIKQPFKLPNKFGAESYTGGELMDGNVFDE